MRTIKRPMAFVVMGFLYLLAAALFTGCGQASYEMIHAESVDSSETESTSSAFGKTESETDISPTEQPKEAAKAEASKTICVYVCGAVNAPGVYELPADARVYQAVAMAGGLREDADAMHLNQAALLTDGEQISVYTKEEAERLGTADAAGAASTKPDAAGADFVSKVNINTAGIQELETLNGIGESRAQDIIAYREANGGFQTIEEIMKVTGIKQSLFGKIKDRITVS